MNKVAPLISPPFVPADAPPPRIPHKRKLTGAQRLSVVSLVVCFVGVASYARWENRRADFWKAEALRLAAQPYEEPRQASAVRYPVTLIGEDGSTTPLAGKALHIDLGGERLLEVDLARHSNGYLHLWSPARRDDSHWSRLVLHPSCANSLYLELVRVRTGSASEGGTDFVETTSP